MLSRLTMLCLILGASSLNAFAQRGSGDTLQSDDIFIVKEYQPKISDAFKLSNNPRVIDTIIKIEPKSEYQIKDKRAETTFETKAIKPAIMKGEPLNKLYRAYVLGGIGNNLTTRGELVINSVRSKKWDWGMHAWHHGSNGGVAEHGFSGFSDNNFNLYGRKFFYNKILSGDLKYDLNSLHRYGFNPNSYPTVVNDQFLSQDLTAQRFQNIEPSLRFKSYYKDSNAINYDAQIAFSNYTDKHSAVENNTRINLALDRYFGEEFVTAEVKLDLNQYEATDPAKNAPISQENTIFGFKPGVVTGGENWQIKAALDLNVSSGNQQGTFVYPDIHAKYNLVDDLLVPYAGVNGGLKRNNFKNLSRTNAFVYSFIPINNQSTRYNLYGGIRGNYSATTSLNIKASYRQVENMAFFYNQVDSLVIPHSVANQFNVLYYNGSVFQLTGEVGYQRVNHLSLLLRADYFVYDINSQAEAWNLPDYKLSLNASYDIGDKIVLTGDVYLMGERVGLTYDPVVDIQYVNQLGVLADVNLGVEYFFTKRWSAFLRTMNLANANYQYWNEYQVQGFTIIGGMTYSFWGNKKRKK